MPLNHFDLFAPYYEKVIGRGMFRDWQPLLQYEGTGCMLDLGGGTGRVAKMIRQNHNFRQMVIADESAGMLREARDAGFQTVLCRSEALPFADASFDRVIMVDAFHHVADQQESINEMTRMLNRGGIVVIEEPDVEHFVIKVLFALEKLALMRTRMVPASSIERMAAPELRSDVLREASTYWVRIFRG